MYPTRPLKADHISNLLEALARNYQSESQDCGPPVTVATAPSIWSRDFRNTTFPTFESFVRTASGEGMLSYPNKDDCPIYTGGVLNNAPGGGVRRIQENVVGFHNWTGDYDKGHVTPDDLIARCSELGFMAGATTSFSSGTQSHKVAWGTTKRNRKTGNTENNPGTFARYCDDRQPTDALAREYAVEIEGYDETALGHVRLGEVATEKSDTTTTTYYILHHGPITKCRLLIPIEPFFRLPGEPLSDFKCRWITFYHAVARLVGFPYDHSCDSLERAFYGFAENTNRPKQADNTRIVRGRILSADDLDLNEPPPERRVRQTHQRDSQLMWDSDLPDMPRPGTPPLEVARILAHRNEVLSVREALTNKWRGFRAADAASDLWDDITDKRDDRGLIAIECPFIDEHATSNRPGTRQLAIYNAKTKNQVPTCICQSDTCKGRPYPDFLEALFSEDMRLAVQYRSK